MRGSGGHHHNRGVARMLGLVHRPRAGGKLPLAPARPAAPKPEEKAVTPAPSSEK